jgi:fluoroquinolone transport system permease protein
MSKIGALLWKDARGIYRDGFLLYMCAYAPLIAIAARLGVPWIPIERLSLYLAPGLVTLGGSLAAIIFGFGLIEERERQTLLLLRVLPLSRTAHFAYLAITTGLLSCALGLAVAAVFGEPVADLPGFLLMLAVSSLLAPLGMLMLGVAAANKIEGMAVAKLVSSMSIVPALVFAVPAPWQVLLAWSPHYWVYLGLLRAYAGEAQLASLAVHWPGHPGWLHPLAATMLCLGGIVLLARIHRARVR